METHPLPTVDTGVARKSDRLAGKAIALAVCGGIGAVETVKVARELRRHGAEVTAFFTPSTSAFITPLALEWATQKPVVVESTGEVVHLQDFALALVAPTTLNTLAKSALGIADNAVTLLVAGQLGRRQPLLFVPAMNEQLRAHPAYAEYVARLRGWGARFFEPPMEEGRLKLPDSETITEQVLKLLA